MTHQDYRYKQAFPKIGIRPTIDGRRKGVRESLEEQTMRMATSVAKLLTAELRYPDGSPVECVVAESCIGGVAEAAAAAELFNRSNVGVTITVTPCWCYGTETMGMSPSIPTAIWGLTVRNGLAQSIWQPYCLHMLRRGFRPSGSMARMFRMAGYDHSR